MSQIVILHIGYPKTATTTLQRCFFEFLRKKNIIDYFGMFLDEPKNGNRTIFFNQLQEIMYSSDEIFNIKKCNLIRELQFLLKSNKKSLPIVISNEHFTISGYSSRLKDVTISTQTTAQRLAEVFEQTEVRLLIGLRRQTSLMRSFFIESATRTHHKNSQYFINLQEFVETATNPKSLFYEMFDFNKCIESDKEAFPNAEIEFYFFEEFQKDQKSVIYSILNFMNINKKILSELKIPLDEKNKKNKTQLGTNIHHYNNILKIISDIKTIRLIINPILRTKIGLQLKLYLQKKEIIKNLSDQQMEKIRNTILRSNKKLCATFPRIKIKMKKYSYI